MRPVSQRPRFGRRLTWVVGALAALALCAAALVAASPGTLDQSQSLVPPDNSLPPRNVTFVAQTYTAGLSGRLDRVDLLLSRLDPLDRNLTVQIRTTVGGLPSGVVLDAVQVAPAQVPVSNFPNLSFVQIPLSGSPSVAGTQYAIVVSDPAAAPFGGPQYLWGESSGNHYPGGEALLSLDGGVTWLTQSGFDMGFKTYVQALPSSKEQCKRGGWQDFPEFKNQGDCVSFVATHGKGGA